MKKGRCTKVNRPKLGRKRPGRAYETSLPHDRYLAVQHRMFNINFKIFAGGQITIEDEMSNS